MKILEKRDYQDRIIDKTITAFSGDLKSVGVVSPTGSGKTIMAMSIIKHYETNFGFRTNWVAMRRNLLRQAAETNNELFHIKNMNFVSMFDDNPPPCDFLVLDESHHAATVSFNHIDSNSGCKFLLGLSATPFRTDRLKLPFQKVITDAGIHRLIQEGWLPPYHHYVTEKYNPEFIANTYTNDADRWGKSVAFFNTVEMCDEFVSYVNKRGISAKVVHGAMPSAEREDILDEFHDGHLKVLANVAILTEGFDCPKIQSIFVRDSSKLPTTQMAGRGFRKCDGKEYCNIIQSIDTHWQFTKTAKPAKSFVQKNEKWYTLGNNDIVDTVAKEVAQVITQIDIEMPQFLLNKRKKQSMV